MVSKKELIKLGNEIVFVTSNKGKIAFAQECLKDIKLEIYEYDLIEPRTDDIREMAESKVRQAYAMVQKPCIALDAGFFIEKLNGFPRAFVNFTLNTLGLKGILKLMEGVENRSCAFKECLTYFNGQNLLFFDGNNECQLATEIRGKDSSKKWSDLWYIFMPYGYDKTLAELTDEERNNRPRCPQNTGAMSEFVDYYHLTKKISNDKETQLSLSK